MYKLVLLRHGRSLADDEEKIEGRYDSPLTDVGIDQAKSTKIVFSELKYEFDAIITSTLKRAMQTAEVINEKYKVPIIKCDLLIERDNGVLAGLKRKDADLKYPIPIDITPFSLFPDRSGESLILLQSRAMLAIEFIIRNSPGRYLIVSHGNFLNAMIRVILGISNPNNESGCIFNFEDNSYIEMDYFEEKNKWIIKRFV